jgi:hypothetical protein
MTVPAGARISVVVEMVTPTVSASASTATGAGTEVEIAGARATEVDAGAGLFASSVRSRLTRLAAGTVGLVAKSGVVPLLLLPAVLLERCAAISEAC